LLGEKDQAFACLERAIELGFDYADLLRSNPALQPLHGDARWQHIIKLIDAKLKP